MADVKIINGYYVKDASAIASVHIDGNIVKTTSRDGVDSSNTIMNAPFSYYGNADGLAGNSTTKLSATAYIDISDKYTLTDGLPADGTVLAIKLPVTGLSTYSYALSVDGGTTYRQFKYNNAALTTQYAAGTTVFAVYRSDLSSDLYLAPGGTKTTVSGAWQISSDYDSNTNTIGYQLRNGNSVYTMGNTLYRYLLLLQKDPSTLVALCTTSNKTTTTKTGFYEGEFDPFGNIFYYSTTTTVNNSSIVAASSLWKQYPCTISYSTNNASSLTASKDVYLVAIPQESGMAKVYYGEETTKTAASYAKAITQTLPTTDDGRIYIKLGNAYDINHVELDVNHPIYYYKDGALRQWVNAPEVATGSNVSFTQNTLSTGTYSIGSITIDDTTTSIYGINTLREIKVNGTLSLSSTSDTALDISAGNNITVAYSNNKVVISATDTNDSTTKAGHYTPTANDGTKYGSNSATSTIITGITKDEKGHITNVSTGSLSITSGKSDISTTSNKLVKASDMVSYLGDYYLNGGVQFLGPIDNPENLVNVDISIGKGDFYRVTSLMFIDEEAAHEGDIIMALNNKPTTNSSVDWDVIHTEMGGGAAWINSSLLDGIVPKGKGHPNKVWTTDASGNPNWGNEVYTTTLNDDLKSLLVGGIAANTLVSSLKGRTMSELFDMILFPTTYPVPSVTHAAYSNNAWNITCTTASKPKNVSTYIVVTPGVSISTATNSRAVTVNSSVQINTISLTESFSTPTNSVGKGTAPSISNLLYGYSLNGVKSSNTSITGTQPTLAVTYTNNFSNATATLSLTSPLAGINSSTRSVTGLTGTTLSIGQSAKVAIPEGVFTFSLAWSNDASASRTSVATAAPAISVNVLSNKGDVSTGTTTANGKTPVDNNKLGTKVSGSTTTYTITGVYQCYTNAGSTSASGTKKAEGSYAASSTGTSFQWNYYSSASYTLYLSFGGVPANKSVIREIYFPTKTATSAKTFSITSVNELNPDKGEYEVNVTSDWIKAGTVTIGGKSYDKWTYDIGCGANDVKFEFKAQ